MNRDGLLAELKDERDKLNAAINALEGLNNSATTTRRRRVSAATRRRLSMAQKARWKQVRKVERKTRKRTTPKEAPLATKD